MDSVRLFIFVLTQMIVVQVMDGVENDNTQSNYCDMRDSNSNSLGYVDHNNRCQKKQ